MRKFGGTRGIRIAAMLTAAVLLALAAFSGAGGWFAYLSALAAGLLLGLLLPYARMRRRVEKQLRHRALHDPLTGLPNRALFAERAEDALLRTVRNPGSVAVLVVDLDDFEEINHGLGYEAGDQLLARVGERLGARVRLGGTVARLGGDEFAVLLEDVPDKNAAISAAKGIEEALGKPVELEGRGISISASIGIAVGGSDRDGFGALLRNADVAMHEAKRKGKACLKMFDPGAGTTTSGRLLVESEMRRAVEEGEFRVYYQPLVTLNSGKISGLEALVRWQHPVYGLIPPGEFVPLAEQTGLISSIGRWVLREACLQARLLQTEYPGDPPLTIAVNVSACQLLQPTLVEETVRILSETGLDPRHLKLEITESVMMQHASVAAALREFENSGIELAMDDFGTGYSNFSRLKHLPIRFLKIDRSYVSGLGTQAEDTAIVHATLAFAQALSLKVIAEGIENAEQASRLRELGCETGQGYHFAKPLTGEGVSQLLATERRR